MRRLRRRTEPPAIFRELERGRCQLLRADVANSDSTPARTAGVISTASSGDEGHPCRAREMADSLPDAQPHQTPGNRAVIPVDPATGGDIRSRA
jgi:hypothetical protein